MACHEYAIPWPRYRGLVTEGPSFGGYGTGRPFRGIAGLRLLPEALLPDYNHPRHSIVSWNSGLIDLKVLCFARGSGTMLFADGS